MTYENYYIVYCIIDFDVTYSLSHSAYTILPMRTHPFMYTIHSTTLYPIIQSINRYSHRPFDLTPGIIPASAEKFFKFQISREGFQSIDEYLVNHRK